MFENVQKDDFLGNVQNDDFSIAYRMMLFFDNVQNDGEMFDNVQNDDFLPSYRMMQNFF